VNLTPFGAMCEFVRSEQAVGADAGGVVEDGVGVGDATLLAIEDITMVLDNAAEGDGSTDEEPMVKEATDEDEGVTEDREMTNEDGIATEVELATDELSVEELVEEVTTRLLLEVFEELMEIEVLADVEDRIDDTGLELQTPNGL
jgi:hypothetical protein